MATLDIAQSDEAMATIKQDCLALLDLCDGYLLRRMWPPTIGDQMQGVLNDIDAWGAVVSGGGGLFNYNDDGQSLMLSGHAPVGGQEPADTEEIL